MNATETTTPSLHPIDWILFPGCQEDADAQAAYLKGRGFNWAKLDADYGMSEIFRSLDRMEWDGCDAAATRRAAERYMSRR
jgi:hypothetical protein